MFGLVSFALALPQGGRINQGSGDLSNPAHIKQNSQHLSTSWRSFDIDGGEAVRISQPNRASSILIRVDGNQPTNINGTLTANGQVHLENNAGIRFGSNSVVNVGGLLASSAKSVESFGSIQAPDSVRLQSVSATERAGVINVGGMVDSADSIIIEADGSVVIGSSAELNAGKSAFVGGGFQGKDGTIENAQTTSVEAGALITTPYAVVWSNDTTDFQGSIDAGEGFVEVSGKRILKSFDLTKVTAKKLLLDPANITIGTAITNDDHITTSGDGTILPDDGVGETFAISADAIKRYLGNISLTATENITVNEEVSKINGNLSLEAPTINLNKKVSVIAHALSLSYSNLITLGAEGSIQTGLLDLVYTGNLTQTFDGDHWAFNNDRSTNDEPTNRSVYITALGARVNLSGDIRVGLGEFELGAQLLGLASATTISSRVVVLSAPTSSRGSQYNLTINADTIDLRANLNIDSNTLTLNYSRRLSINVTPQAGGLIINNSGDIVLNFSSTEWKLYGRRSVGINSPNARVELGGEYILDGGLFSVTAKELVLNDETVIEASSVVFDIAEAGRKPSNEMLTIKATQIHLANHLDLGATSLNLFYGARLTSENLTLTVANLNIIENSFDGGTIGFPGNHWAFADGRNVSLTSMWDPNFGGKNIAFSGTINLGTGNLSVDASSIQWKDVGAHTIRANDIIFTARGGNGIVLNGLSKTIAAAGNLTLASNTISLDRPNSVDNPSLTLSAGGEIRLSKDTHFAIFAGSLTLGGTIDAGDKVVSIKNSMTPTAPSLGNVTLHLSGATTIEASEIVLGVTADMMNNEKLTLTSSGNISFIEGSAIDLGTGDSVLTYSGSLQGSAMLITDNLSLTYTGAEVQAFDGSHFIFAEGRTVAIIAEDALVMLGGDADLGIGDFQLTAMGLDLSEAFSISAGAVNFNIATGSAMPINKNLTIKAGGDITLPRDLNLGTGDIALTYGRTLQDNRTLTSDNLSLTYTGAEVQAFNSSHFIFAEVGRTVAITTARGLSISGTFNLGAGALILRAGAGAGTGTLTFPGGMNITASNLTLAQDSAPDDKSVIRVDGDIQIITRDILRIPAGVTEIKGGDIIINVARVLVGDTFGDLTEGLTINASGHLRFGGYVKSAKDITLDAAESLGFSATRYTRIEGKNVRIGGAAADALGFGQNVQLVATDGLVLLNRSLKLGRGSLHIVATAGISTAENDIELVADEVVVNVGAGAAGGVVSDFSITAQRAIHFAGTTSSFARTAGLSLTTALSLTADFINTPSTYIFDSAPLKVVAGGVPFNGTSLARGQLRRLQECGALTCP